MMVRWLIVTTPRIVRAPLLLSCCTITFFARGRQGRLRPLGGACVVRNDAPARTTIITAHHQPRARDR